MRSVFWVPLLFVMLLGCQRSEPNNAAGPSKLEQLFSGSGDNQDRLKAEREAQRQRLDALQQERLQSYNDKGSFESN